MAVSAFELSTPPSHQHPFHKTKRVRTLVVDDSPVFAELACFVLEQQPAIELIGTARDGAEGIQTALLVRPDLIVMDIHMPGMDGLSATTCLLSELPTAKIILMSSESTSFLQSECRQRGAVAFVPKVGFAEEIEAALQALRLNQEM